MHFSNDCISRSTFLPFSARPLAVIFMHRAFISLRNSSGSCGIRFFNPCLGMSTVAIIRVRATSRNRTQSVGKYICLQAGAAEIYIIIADRIRQAEGGGRRLRCAVVCCSCRERGGEFLVDDSQAFFTDPLPEAVTRTLGECFDRIVLSHMEEPLQ